MFADLWIKTVQTVVHADASAALGIIARRGLRKCRHIHVQQLWTQAAREAGTIKYVKIFGLNNPADLLTKSLEEAKIVRYLQALGMFFTNGKGEVSKLVDQAPTKHVQKSGDIHQLIKRKRRELH